MFLETERLILRPFNASDLEEIHRLVYADAVVADEWTGYNRDFDSLRERFNNSTLWHAENGFGFLAIVRKVDSQLLGLVTTPAPKGAGFLQNA